MPNSLSHRRLFSRCLAGLALVALGAGLSGCAGMSDAISPAFADPAKYDLYDCKQLEPERKSLANRSAELQGLMAKAETTPSRSRRSVPTRLTRLLAARAA